MKSYFVTPNEKNLFSLSVSEEIVNLLKGAHFWSIFISIVNFILIAIMLGMALVLIVFSKQLEVLTNANPNEQFYLSTIIPALGVIYVILSIVLFFPALYLYQFGTKSKNAILLNDQTEFNAAFKGLKGYFKFNGILLIAVLVIYFISMFLMFILAHELS